VMYPKGFATTVTTGGPANAQLEDRIRPTHFAGVATVVTKLLNQAQADIAVFGEKDYQQLLVIKRLARDLDIPTQILGAPTMRETDGLALSSRNMYLSPAERARAPALYAALCDAAHRIAKGDPVIDATEMARASVAGAGFDVDYLEARHADTLAPIGSPSDGPIRLLAAGRLGATRLIDNVAAPV
ncbi:MAG: pantoate--beta-alanine ligase, partial [Methylocystis sp.]|nr:pantoate--beta-alanine ligase [Methylocystis sp.]